MNKLHWIFRYIIGVTLMAYTFSDYLGRYTPFNFWNFGIKRTNANGVTVQKYNELQKYNDYIAQGLSPEEAEASTSWWDRNPISSAFGSTYGTDYAKRATLAMMLDNTGKVKINDPKVDKLLTIGKALDRTNWAPWDFGTTEGNFTLDFSDDDQAEIPQYLIDLYDNDPKFKNKIDLAARETNQGLGQKINTELSGMQDDFKAWKDWKAGNGTWRGKSNDSEGTSVNAENLGQPNSNYNDIGKTILEENKKEADRLAKEAEQESQQKMKDDVAKLRAEAKQKYEDAININGKSKQQAFEEWNQYMAEGMAKIPGTQEYEQAQIQKELEAKRLKEQQDRDNANAAWEARKTEHMHRHKENPSDMNNLYYSVAEDPNYPNNPNSIQYRRSHTPPVNTVSDSLWTRRWSNR